MSNEVATRPDSGGSLIARLAERYAIEPDKMKSTLIATAFRQRGKDGKPAPVVTDEQMMMLLVVADQYKLNPFTREIYAFPSEGGIVAIVSIDGWIRIINERPELKSISFEMAPAGTEDPWISCAIERTDRAKPTVITEFLSECSRNTDPWNQMPRRMLRHKALIQCARVAFGFGGIFDPDEGDRIVSVVEQPTRKMAPLPQVESERQSVDTTTGEIRNAQSGETSSQSGETTTPEPVMPEGEVADHLAAIDAASTLNDLKTAHAKSYAAAHRVGDGKALLRFEVAKNKRKYELTKGGAT